MTNSLSTQTTLVLGGTGKTGRRVVERLEARGVPVRAGSRSATTPFDWEDPSTWKPALVDVDAVYVTFFPDLAFPGAADAISAFTEVAVSSGVRKLVLLSGRGEPEAQRCEQIVQGHDIDWTCVRASMFNQNFDEYFLLESVEGTIFDGRNVYVADGVQQALGRPPNDFTDYARSAAATGVWSA